MRQDDSVLLRLRKVPVVYIGIMVTAFCEKYKKRKWTELTVRFNRVMGKKER